jgi:hypothetical protein
MEHAQYHELLRQNMGVSAGVPTESRKNGDLELLVSAFDTMVSNIHHSFRLVTAVRGRKHVQLLVSGLKSNEKNVDAQLPLIIRGLDVPKSTLKIMERKGRVLTDHRLGFEMRYEDGWLAEQMNIPGIEALGNMITLSRKNTVCIGMAICATEGFDEDVAIESMMQTSQVHVDPTSRTETRSKLARIPARQFAFSGRRGGVKVTLTAWIAHRGNTAYLLLVIAEATELSKPEAFRRFFALID